MNKTLLHFIVGILLSVGLVVAVLSKNYIVIIIIGFAGMGLVIWMARKEADLEHSQQEADNESCRSD